MRLNHAIGAFLAVLAGLPPLLAAGGEGNPLPESMAEDAGVPRIVIIKCASADMVQMWCVWKMACPYDFITVRQDIKPAAAPKAKNPHPCEKKKMKPFPRNSYHPSFFRYGLYCFGGLFFVICLIQGGRYLIYDPKRKRVMIRGVRDFFYPSAAEDDIAPYGAPAKPAAPEEPCPPPPEKPVPAEKPEPPKPKDEWELFLSTPAPAGLTEIYPGFCMPEPGAGTGDGAPAPAPTLEEVDALLQEPWCVQAVQYYKDFEKQLNTANRFLDWSKARPAGEALQMQAGPDDHYWFVGDVHASFTAALKAFAFVRSCMSSLAGRHHLIFLGDYIDRGPDSLALLAFLQVLLMKYSGDDSPLRVYTLKGNHDLGLSELPEGGFASRVSPSETTDLLNAMYETDPESAITLGNAAMELARVSAYVGEICGLDESRPANSILFTHGGVPHVDLQERIYRHARHSEDGGILSGMGDDLKAACCRDFAWLRMVDNLPRKFPNRASSGCEIGTEDVNVFRRIHFERTGRAVSFIIRGHDHRNGLDSFDAAYHADSKRYQKCCGVLTLQTREPDTAESRLSMERDLGLAYWRRGGKVCFFRLPTHHLSPAVAAGGNISSTDC